MDKEGIPASPCCGMAGQLPNACALQQQRSLEDQPARKEKNNIYCRVPSCDNVLNDLKRYHKRYRICPEHLKMSHLVLEGTDCRFCQLCGKFQPLSEFDGAKRSCRAKLARHNERRQKYKDLDYILDGYTEPCQKKEQDVKKEPARTNQVGAFPQPMYKGIWNPSAGPMYHKIPMLYKNYFQTEGMPSGRDNNAASDGGYLYPGMQLPPNEGSHPMNSLIKCLLSQSMGTGRINVKSGNTGFEKYMGNPQDVLPQNCQPGGCSGQCNTLNELMEKTYPDTKILFQGLKQDAALRLLKGLLEFLTNGQGTQ